MLDEISPSTRPPLAAAALLDRGTMVGAARLVGLGPVLSLRCPGVLLLEREREREMESASSPTSPDLKLLSFSHEGWPSQLT